MTLAIGVGLIIGLILFVAAFGMWLTVQEMKAGIEEAADRSARRQLEQGKP